MRDWTNALFENNLTQVAQWLGPEGTLVRNLNVFDTGESLLHKAAYMGRHEMVALMLPYGKPNQLDEEGLTPLMVAARSESVPTVNVLLPVSNPHLTDQLGRNALHLAAAARDGHADVISALMTTLSATTRSKLDRRLPLHEACATAPSSPRDNILAKLDRLLPAGGVDVQDARGDTPLMLAFGCLRVARLDVIARLAPLSNLALRNQDQVTVMDLARQQDDHQVVQILETAELNQALTTGPRPLPAPPRHRL